MNFMQKKLSKIRQRIANKKTSDTLVEQFNNWDIKVSKPIEFLADSGHYSGESIPVNMEFKNPKTDTSYQIVIATDAYPERGSFDDSEYSTNWNGYKSKVEIYKYNKNGNEVSAHYESEGNIYKRSMYTILSRLNPNCMTDENNGCLSDNPEFAAIFKCAMSKFYSLDSTDCNSFARPFETEFETSITKDCQLGGNDGIIKKLKAYEYSKLQDEMDFPKLEKSINPQKRSITSRDVR